MVVAKVAAQKAALAAGIAAGIEAAVVRGRSEIAGCTGGTAGIGSRKDVALSLVVYPSSCRYGASSGSRTRCQ